MPPRPIDFTSQHPDYEQDYDYEYGSASQYGRSSSQYSRSGGGAGRSFKLSTSLESRSSARAARKSPGKRSPLLKPHGPTYIARLPAEGLALCFARLPPETLRTCSLVCKDWRSIILEDATWRSALLYHFKLDEDLRNVPGRRLAPTSWREEYMLRYDLAQKWSRSKVPTITHDPRVGNITSINADTALRRLEPTSQASKSAKNPHGSAPSMISFSLSRGTASRSDPYNGKVAKGGMMEGAPSGFGWETVTAAAISKDGGCIVWGMATGAINVSRTGLAGRFVHGQGQRASAASPLSKASENHAGIVTAVTFLGQSEIAATCGSDASVKLWDCTTGFVWSSSEVLHTADGRVDEPVLLTASSCSDGITLACGTRLGSTHMWKIDSKSWTTVSFHSTAGKGEIKQLLLDGTSVLVHYEGDEQFHRISRASKRVFGHHEGFLGEITAVAADFQKSEQTKTSAPISIDGKVVSVVETSSATSLDFGRMAFVVAGDAQGRTFLWFWDAEGEGFVRPVRQLQGFETKVTAIEITEVVILLGSADGMIRVYDLLSGSLVRVFNERSAPRHALRDPDPEEQAKWAVKQISASRYGFVACIGARVLAWRVGEDRFKKRTNRTGGRLSSRAERYMNDQELKHDIRESTQEIQQEQEQRHVTRYHLDQQGEMTEEEALAFAILQSQEDMSLELDHLRLEEEEDWSYLDEV